MRSDRGRNGDQKCARRADDRRCRNLLPVQHWADIPLVRPNLNELDLPAVDEEAAPRRKDGVRAARETHAEQVAVDVQLGMQQEAVLFFGGLRRLVRLRKGPPLEYSDCSER